MPEKEVGEPGTEKKGTERAGREGRQGDANLAHG